MNEIEKIIVFFEEKFSDAEINEDVLLFELIDNSIDFITILSELEDVIEKEICIEKISDITKFTIGDIPEYTE